MKFFVAVLMAAVTVNCLVTAINGKEASDTLAVPHIDTLLPPLKDEQDNSRNNAPAKINATAETTSVYTTTAEAITSTNTEKSITNNENKILPKPSIEALLPPLFESKIEKEEPTTRPSTTTKATLITTSTTTRRPTTITTKRLTTPTATASYTSSTTTLKPNLKVPDLLLDPLQVPLRSGDGADDKDKIITPITTQNPITTTTTKYNTQQQTKHIQVKTAGSLIENKPALNDRHVAESKTIDQQVAFKPPQHVNMLQSQFATYKSKYIAKEKTTSPKFVDRQLNNSFDLYFGSTTAKPAKSGLPTITPFPHRLGR